MCLVDQTVKPSNELSRLLHVIVREKQHHLSKKLANNGETVQLSFKESCYKTGEPALVKTTGSCLMRLVLKLIKSEKLDL